MSKKINALSISQLLTGRACEFSAHINKSFTDFYHTGSISKVSKIYSSFIKNY